MASDPFNSLSGYTIGIPPYTVVDANGNISANKANIGNITANVITANGNITAHYFLGNVVGNISGNIVVPGTNTSVLFNNDGNAGASDAFQFDYTTNVVTVSGNIAVSNLLTDNIFYANGDPYVFVASAAGSNNQIQYNSNGGLAATSNLIYNPSTQTLGTINFTATSALITEIETDGLVVDGNITSDFITSNLIGNTVNATSVTANTLSGSLTTNAQPNITSLGLLTGLNVAGNIIPGANNQYNLGNISNRWHELYLAGNTIYLGNATFEANATSVIITDPSGHVFILGGASGNDIIAAGNVIAGANLVGSNVQGGNLVTANYLSGTLTVGPQPNITQVGTLSNLTVTGNVNAANLISVNGVSANTLSGVLLTGTQPNITTVGNLISLRVLGNANANNFNGNFYGNGAGLTNLNAANIIGNIPNANYAQFSNIANTANTATTANTAGTVTVASQPNITSVGTLSSLLVSGNANANNFNGKFYGNGIGLTNIAGANITGNVANADFAANANYANTANTATLSTRAVNVTANAQPNITSVGTLLSLNLSGNITNANWVFSDYFSGNGSQLFYMNAANVIGTVANANYAAYANIANTANTTNVANYATYVTGATQSNITTLGTLTGLNANGNIIAKNITANTGVFTGNGSGLTDITGANITGTVANANYAANSNYANSANTANHSTSANTVTNAAQPLITSVGNLTSLNVVGNVTADYFIGNIVGNISNAIYANTAGTVVTNAQPNITSVGTLSNLSVSGNVTASNFIGNFIGAISNANFAAYAGNVLISSQPNITSVGNLTSLNVVGNITAGNINGGNLVVANFLTGTLTTETQSNIHTVGNLGYLNVDSNSANGNGSIWFSGNLYGNGAQSDIDVTGNIYSGNLHGTLVAGTLTTNFQPNVWTVGNLLFLNVVGPTDLGPASNITITGGSNGYVLSTDGTGNLSWVAQANGGGGNGTPGGNNTQVQYNDNGNFAGSPYFTWNHSTRVLVVGGNLGVNDTGTFQNVYSSNNAVLKNINANGTVNFTSSGNVTLGNIANVHIGGGFANYFLSTDGNGNLSWKSGTSNGGGTPGGSNRTVQYNDAGTFGGDAYFTFNEVSKTVTIAGDLISNSVTLGAGIYQFSRSNVYMATTNDATANQVILEVPVEDLEGIDYHIISTDTAGNIRCISKISSAVLGSTVNYNEYSTLPINGYVGDWSVGYQAGNVLANAQVVLYFSPQTANLMTHKISITAYGQ